MELLIKNVRLVDYKNDFTGDIYIKNGLISETGQELFKACPVVQGKGLTLMPAFADMHCHFRDPGFTYKEDIESGSKAAVRGGYTIVNLMANTNPVCSTMETVNYVISKGQCIGLIDIHQTVSITRDMDGKTLDHIEKLDDKVRFLSEDGRGVEDNRVILDAMLKAKEMGKGIITHAEFKDITPVSTRLSENLMTIRDIALSEYTGCHLHMAHVSTEEAMREIINAKKRGAKVTCEVTPHHLSYIFDKEYRVNPPVREAKDIEYIRKAIKQGYVDAIGTDHAPHTEEDKKNGAPGISGIETSFQVVYTSLVREGLIDLKKLSEIMSKNPCKLLGVNKGTLEPGLEADLVLIDTEKKIKVDTSDFQSKGKNTPINGAELYGEIIATFKSGKLVYGKDDLV